MAPPAPIQTAASGLKLCATLLSLCVGGGTVIPLLMLDPLFLQVLPGAPGAAVPVPVVSGFRAEVVPLVVHLIGALAILLVGGLLAGLVRFFLRKFSLDSRLCSAVPNGLDRSCAATIYPVLDKPRSTGIQGA